MKEKLGHALLAACVVTACGFGLGKAMDAMPRGRLHDAAERFVLEPGRALAERVGDNRAVKKARKSAAKKLESAAEKLEDAGVADANRVAALYTTGAWAGLGFVVCLLLALALGISSAGSALALGFKVSLAFFFLQGAFVCGLAFLAWRR